MVGKHLCSNRMQNILTNVTMVCREIEEEERCVDEQGVCVCVRTCSNVSTTNMHLSYSDPEVRIDLAMWVSVLSSTHV